MRMDDVFWISTTVTEMTTVETGQMSPTVVSLPLITYSHCNDIIKLIGFNGGKTQPLRLILNYSMGYFYTLTYYAFKDQSTITDLQIRKDKGLKIKMFLFCF